MVENYLKASNYIDFHDPAISKQAELLSRGAKDEDEVVKRCFEFVRDKIKHSWDYKLNPVTCRASDVLLHGTGYCYAKSHLLAALLRKNGIPTGLCYQRVSVYDSGAPYCLHGLNAVYLKSMAGTESTPEEINLMFMLSSVHRVKLWPFQFKTKKSVTSRKSGRNLYLWSLTFLNNMTMLSKCLIICRIFSCGANQSFRPLNSTVGTGG